ncbi:MAG: acyl-CoA thioesterase [Clostridiales bacterium]|nr:acyl-CoA thioesterase [Clostridiales bacterium]
MEVTYKRRINYYETDKMGVVHHANYLRYFEEARIYFLDEAGLSYKEIEAAGVIMPVLGVDISYKASLDFDDVLYLKTSLSYVKGAKAAFSYEGYNEQGKLVCKGTSTHGFVKKDFKPTILKKDFPQIYEILSKTVPSV